MAGRCGLLCDKGFSDCDGDPGNGCERPTATDVMNCGACGHACTGQSPACIDSHCAGPTMTMSWTDGNTNACDDNITARMAQIRDAMPSGKINVVVTAHLVAPRSGSGTWSATFLGVDCIRTFLDAWARRDLSNGLAWQGWANSWCVATDTLGVSYTFSVLDDGAKNPDIAIHPTGAAPGTMLSLQTIDRTFQACDLFNVDGGFNSSTAGTAGDTLSFGWW